MKTKSRSFAALRMTADGLGMISGHRDTNGLEVLEARVAAGALIEQAKAEPTGRKWRVRVFEYGLSKNRYPYSGNAAGRNACATAEKGNGNMAGKNACPTSLPLQWTERSARAALRHLEGARCFADHVREGTNGAGHSVRDLIGFFSDPRIGPRGPEATLTLLESEDWARTKLLAAWQAERMDLIGFSVDAVIGVRPVGEGTARALEVEDIVAIHSVDMVSAASSGGRALEVLENQESGARSQESGQDSDERKEKQIPSASSGQALRGVYPEREEGQILRSAQNDREWGQDDRDGEQGDSGRARDDSKVAVHEGRSNHGKGVAMKREIERMLEALQVATRDSEFGTHGLAGAEARAEESDSGAEAKFRVAEAGRNACANSASERLREALTRELESSEVDAARVLEALGDWLAQEGQSTAAGKNACATSPEVALVSEQVQGLRQQISDAVRRQRMAENRLRVDGKLAASRLPKPLAELVARRFQPDGPYGGRELTEEEVEMEIQRVREAYAALSPVGRVMETGRVKVGREPEEKLQMALDRLFNLPAEDPSVPAFHGIREAYIAYTGDGEVTGLLPHQMRIREDLTSTTFPNALGNTLRRLLLKDYREQDYGVGLIAQYSSVPDFRTQERVRVGYFGDLPTVDPEAADYGELTAPTDEKASYSVVTFGGLVTITRKMIINDDLGVVPQIVGRLGRSARRTLAQRVFNLLITNPIIYDGLAWFHATHGNLGATALSATELNAVRTAMRNRTEKDSNKKLGIAPYVLVVPHELEGTARQENMREYLDAIFTPNPVRFLFGANGERIIVSPLLTDANDWYAFANVAEAPTVEVGFLQGRQEPEFFLADDPTSEKVFTSDRIRYKVRHEFEAVVIDFRGAFKEAVI